MKICPDCHKAVTALDAVEIGGQFYHKSCRTCFKCGMVIDDKSKKAVCEGHSYHYDCLHSDQVCSICGNVTHHYIRDHWGNVACVSHGHVCSYCGSIDNTGKSYDLTYVINGEMRPSPSWMCLRCSDSIVKSVADVERCRSEVMAIFSANGINGIPADIPILISDLRKEEQDMGHGLFGLNISHISASRSRYSCEVIIHQNLPYVMFKGILAHELLHSWVRLYSIQLPQNEEEGLCNLAKYLVLKQDKSLQAKYLIDWFLVNNRDPVYGEGFRLMKKRLDKLGWKGLLDALLWEKK